MSTSTFPPDFLWGCATSSPQVEGGNDNDWTRWETRRGAIADGVSRTPTAWSAGCVAWRRLASRSS